MRRYPKFHLGSNETEIVEQYISLGFFVQLQWFFQKDNCQTNNTGKKSNVCCNWEKAKALRLLYPLILFVDCLMLVWSLLCCMEIRNLGLWKFRDVQIFGRGFMRLMLKVFKFTPNAMLYGELGATDMSTIMHNRIINFWLKLEFSPLNKFT